MSVGGFCWMERNTHRVLPPSALASNVLCNRHNSALHVLDDVAIRLFSSIQQFHSEHEHSHPDRCADRLLHLNGHNIERWMLKVLCGLSASGVMPPSPRGDRSHEPNKDWIRVIWGEKELAPHQGLVLQAGIGDNIAISRSVTAGFLFDEATDELAGLYMEFGGVRIALEMSDRRRLPGIFRPLYLEFRQLGVASKVIQFAWDRSGDERGATVDWFPKTKEP